MQPITTAVSQNIKRIWEQNRLTLDAPAAVFRAAYWRGSKSARQIQRIAFDEQRLFKTYRIGIAPGGSLQAEG